MKIQIRQINDRNGNSYPIWDLMKMDKYGKWLSTCTWFNEEDIPKEYKNIRREDLRNEEDKSL